MNWLSSPLVATAVVCAILTALAIPLRRLTTDRVAVETPVTSVESASTHHGHTHAFPGMLRLRLLAPAESVEVTTTDGTVLWSARRLNAGEHEMNTDFLLIDDALELLVTATFDHAAGDTALFLTVLPDGVHEQTHYAIGSGRIDEILFFEWQLH